MRAGQIKGDFTALTAARLGGSAAVRFLIARQEGGWEGRRRRTRTRRVGVGCNDAEVQSSSQPGYMGGNGQAAAAYSG